MKDIRELASQFRMAIDLAKENGEFDGDFSFKTFPKGCCGDASDLLAQFLLENGIKTYYVCGKYYGKSYEDWCSHAWLMTGENVIIDITGDQFKQEPKFYNNNAKTYVGMGNEFYKLFEVESRDIHEDKGIYSLNSMCLPRLVKLYKAIAKYII